MLVSRNCLKAGFHLVYKEGKADECRGITKFILSKANVLTRATLLRLL